MVSGHGCKAPGRHLEFLFHSLQWSLMLEIHLNHVHVPHSRPATCPHHDSPCSLLKPTVLHTLALLWVCSSCCALFLLKKRKECTVKCVFEKRITLTKNVFKCAGKFLLNKKVEVRKHINCLLFMNFSEINVRLHLCYTDRKV